MSITFHYKRSAAKLCENGHNAAVAQWIEYWPPKPRVAGSIPASRAKYALNKASFMSNITFPSTVAPDLKAAIESSPARRMVKERLVEGIIDGQLAPGARLVERELCAQLGVSRTPLREALRELENEGLIENVPNKGPIVTVISSEQAADIYASCSALESLVIKQFTERASEEQIQRLAQAITLIDTVYNHYFPRHVLQSKALFYKRLFEGASNDAAKHSLRALHAHVNKWFGKSLEDPARRQQSLNELAQLLHKVRNRDVKGAQDKMTQHLNNSAQAALAVLR